MFIVGYEDKGAADKLHHNILPMSQVCVYEEGRPCLPISKPVRISETELEEESAIQIHRAGSGHCRRRSPGLININRGY